MKACDVGSLSAVKRAVADGADVLAGSEDAACVSPIRLAVRCGVLAVIKWLVEESGWSIDLTALDNETVQIAAAHGHLDVIRYLVEDSGQPVDLAADNSSALRWAAWNGHLPVVKYIIEDHRPAIDLTSELGHTLLRDLSEQSQPEIMTYFFQECPQAAQLQVEPMLADIVCDYRDVSLEKIHALVSAAALRAKQEIAQQFETKSEVISLKQNRQEISAQVVAEQQLALRTRQQEMQQHVEYSAKKQLVRYSSSEACKKAVLSGLVTTLSQLEDLITATSKQPPCRRL